MNCPVCNGRTIGKVGIEQYYCWDCCVEFSCSSDKVVIYDLEEDGSLIAWDEVPLEAGDLPVALE
ncbi:MAG: hypothetical protein LBT32_08330 [Peptococcaceae bacterium]|nr:hypothetical protein [Peptococcaceae bacterium]